MSVVITPSGNITIVENSRIYMVNPTIPFYDMIREEIDKNNISNALKLCNPTIDTIACKEFKDSVDKLNIDLSPKICLYLYTLKNDKKYVSFFDKLNKNKNKHNKENILHYIKNYDIVISDDGDLIVYKSVDSDFKDFRTTSLDNSVGSVVSLPEEECDFKEHTCGPGLHVSTMNYAISFGGMNNNNSSSNKLLLVKVNPEDIIFVNTNDEVFRTTKYTVVSEVENF